MVVPVLWFAVFLILLAVMLFISIILWKRYKARKASLLEEELEELEVVDEDMDSAIRVIENMQLMELEKRQMISPLANAISGDVASKEAASLAVVSGKAASGKVAAGKVASDEVVSKEFVSDEAVVLDDIAAGANKVGGVSFFWRPFTFAPRNPQLLESCEEMPEVIYEQDGIHYIKKNLSIDKNTEEKLDNNFMRLVETVVGKT